MASLKLMFLVLVGVMGLSSLVSSQEPIAHHLLRRAVPLEDVVDVEEIDEDADVKTPLALSRERVERDAGYGGGHGGYGKGRVGPVRTFVKTDYHGNFKWGVRHVAGKKYAH